MAEKSKKPAIRFAGFTEAWEQRKLGEVVDVCSGCDYKQLSAGNIPVYGTGGYMLSVNSALSYKNDAIGIGRKGTIDKPYILNAPFWTVDTLFYAIPRGNNDLDFIFDIFQNVDWRTKDESTGVPSLSKNAINNINILTPKYDEQRIVGSYFSKLDTLITLHQRKYDKLVNVKKAMLEKMFPKDGADVPTIRFKGFTEAWEQRKFNELYEKVSEKNDLTYGKEDIISVANMYYKTDSYITNPEYLKTYNVFHFGDIAFEGNKNKNFAHGRFVENTIGNGIISHVFDVFRPKMKYEYLFWKYAINNERIMGRILLKCTKSSTMMTNLVAADFLKEQIFVPSLNEQKLIGNYIYKIDNLITLHQRKLEKLKNLKKACLEKMFV